MKRPSFRSNISRWIKIYHSINIVSRNIDRSIEARWFLTSMIARWMKAFSSRLRLDLIEFQLRRRKFRGGPPRYLIFLRRFRMRVRRGLKGTPRVTTFLGHRLTNEKRVKFVFFFFFTFFSYCFLAKTRWIVHERLSIIIIIEPGDAILRFIQAK